MQFRHFTNSHTLRQITNKSFSRYYPTRISFAIFLSQHQWSSLLSSNIAGDPAATAFFPSSSLACDKECQPAAKSRLSKMTSSRTNNYLFQGVANRRTFNRFKHRYLLAIRSVLITINILTLFIFSANVVSQICINTDLHILKISSTVRKLADHFS